MQPAMTVQTLLAPNPGPMTGPGTNTYILSDASGIGKCTVIDPGTAEQSHLEAIQNYCMQHGGIERILITHAHPDHIGGSAELAAMTGAAVWAMDHTERGVPHASVMAHDGEQIEIGRQHATVIATPGHRFDHFSLWFAPDRWLLAGDLLAGKGTVVIIPPNGNMIDYLASLRRVQQLPLRIIYPGHYDPITNPHEYVSLYIQHRLQREALILEHLAAQKQPISLHDLTPLIYTDTPAAMHLWASKSLLAHLIKLEAESSAMRIFQTDEGPWTIVR